MKLLASAKATAKAKAKAKATIGKGKAEAAKGKRMWLGATEAQEIDDKVDVSHLFKSC